jgi:hypothetical protein
LQENLALPNSNSNVLERLAVETEVFSRNQCLDQSDSFFEIFFEIQGHQIQNPLQAQLLSETQ